ncbi:transporter, major facilitator family protein [Leptospira broomii serovar Hurstbridge str. 5399]|uniref:Transporter, major facilitator family protein n=1 Tax=Leptospira broomii serovar Hurstbridge str. 5399 TaxID=1049789 RepID=T0GCW2_9LEPT|nr:peptide MFS transporter [Leptospira broomii]EQA43258.1 transporter, major facilitator family protein [Leptospira broomii serovar Hurstbridge str. 5399]
MAVESQGKLRHPKGLFILFLVEMWERFSFYGMRALLVLFLTKEWLLSDPEANRIYGVYNGLVYLTPIFGGFLADRFLGYRSSIFLGGLLMMFGHLSLAIDGSITFFLGLALLILGNGFFKPCISTVVGRIYELEGKSDLKDSGFTIFYFGINTGAVLGTWACANIADIYGWHYGFGVAAVGMLTGLLIFAFLGRKIAGEAFLPGKDKNSKIGSEGSQLDSSSTGLVTAGRIRAILVFSSVTIVFWASFEQMGSSLNLIIDRYVDRNFYGWEIPAANYQSLNPIFVILFSLGISWAWRKLEASGIHVSSVTKFCSALITLACGFLILSVVTSVSSGKFSSGWIVLAILFHTIGELLISPVGLSLITKLAPARMASMMMGIFFLSSFFGHVIAGELAGLMGGRENLSVFFLIFVIFPGLVGIFLFLFRKKLEYWMHGVR